MFKSIRSFSLCLVLTVFCLARVQAQFTQDVFIDAPSIEQDKIITKIYFPAGYDETSPKQYRWMIYIHGATPSQNFTVAQELEPAADKVFSRFTNNDPLVIVMPNLKVSLSPDFADLHMCTDSEYFGNFEQAILHDLLTGLKQEETLALKDKLSFVREHMAIGGYSMGGNGALQIGFKYPEMFGVVAVNSALATIYEPALNFVLTEAKLDCTGDCDILDPNDALNSGPVSLLWGLSAAFDNVVDGKIDFILDENLNIRHDVLARWMDAYDPMTIIKDKQLYKGNQDGPKFMVNIARNDPYRFATQYFEEELQAYGVPTDRYRIVHDDIGAHPLIATRVEEVLRYVLFELQPVETVGVKNYANVIGLSVFPSLLLPGERKINLEFRMERPMGPLSIEFLSMDGQTLSTTYRRDYSRGSNSMVVDAPYEPGAYLCRITWDNRMAWQTIMVQ